MLAIELEVVTLQNKCKEFDQDSVAWSLLVRVSQTGKSPYINIPIIIVSLTGSSATKGIFV